MTENNEKDKCDGAGNASIMHTSPQEQWQQQQNFVNKQIKLQNYCLQLARLFKAGQGNFTVYK